VLLSRDPLSLPCAVSNTILDLPKLGGIAGWLELEEVGCHEPKLG
jgi:hypothetical protein